MIRELLNLQGVAAWRVLHTYFYDFPNSWSLPSLLPLLWYRFTFFDKHSRWHSAHHWRTASKTRFKFHSPENQDYCSNIFSNTLHGETWLLLVQSCHRLPRRFLCSKMQSQQLKGYRIITYPEGPETSMRHVLLISLFYGNLFQRIKKGAIHPIIQRSLLKFTAPLTMWQGLYSSLFYAKKHEKIQDRFLLEETDRLEPTAFDLVTGVQSGTGAKRLEKCVSFHVQPRRWCQPWFTWWVQGTVRRTARLWLTFSFFFSQGR